VVVIGVVVEDGKGRDNIGVLNGERKQMESRDKVMAFCGSFITPN